MSVLKEPLRSGKEFWEATKTLQTLREKEYFTRDCGDDVKSGYPQVLREMIADGEWPCDLLQQECNAANI